MKKKIKSLVTAINKLAVILAICSATTLLATMNFAHASLVSISGNINEITPPSAVYIGALQNNNAAFVFAERQGVAYSGFAALVNSQESVSRGLDFLTGFFDVTDESQFSLFQHTATGRVDGTNNLSPGSPKIGTLLDSYFIHFEPTPAVDQSINYLSTGTISFDTEILGINSIGMSEPGRNELANLLTEIPTTDYGRIWTAGSAGSYQGELELSSVCGQLGDHFEISSDRRSLSFCFSANGAADQLRIITASSIPEPATIALFCLGLLGLGVMHRKSK